MNPKIIYPVPKRQYRFYKHLRNIARYSFILAGAICLLVNYLVKGKAWSIIVVWSLFATWRLIFSLDLVEFSIYSHAIKVMFYLIVLLILIDRFLAPDRPVCLSSGHVYHLFHHLWPQKKTSFVDYDVRHSEPYSDPIFSFLADQKLGRFCL